ncbi:MAG: hypothetical protein R3B72_51665 [Polyangiaceae bacterium]
MARKRHTRRSRNGPGDRSEAARARLEELGVLAREELIELLGVPEGLLGFASVGNPPERSASWFVKDRALDLELVLAPGYQGPDIPLALVPRLVLWRFLNRYARFPGGLHRRLERLGGREAEWPRPDVSAYGWHVAHAAVTSDLVIPLLGELMSHPTIAVQKPEWDWYMFYLFEVAFWCGVEVTARQHADGYAYELNGSALAPNAVPLIADFDMRWFDLRNRGEDYISTGRWASTEPRGQVLDVGMPDVVEVEDSVSVELIR